MSIFPSLPETAHLRDLFRAFPDGLLHLFRFHDAVLRRKSPLSIGERELIAAFVSRLNNCAFCFNAHRTYAEEFGIEQEVLDAIDANPEKLPAMGRLTPVMEYARAVAENDTRAAEKHAARAYEAGWDEAALYDAMRVAALFSYMNRVIHGAGIQPHKDFYDRLLHQHRKVPLEERKKRNEERLGGHYYESIMDMAGIDKEKAQ